MLLDLNLKVDRILGHKTIDIDLSCLTLPPNSVDGLGIVCRIPVLVDYKGVIGLRQIETCTSNKGRNQEDSFMRSWLLDLINDTLPVIICHFASKNFLGIVYL